MVSHTASLSNHWKNIWDQSPFKMAYHRIKTKLLDEVEQITDWIKWLFHAKILRTMAMTSASVLLALNVSWCSVTHNLWHWVKATWNPFELWVRCESSLDSWNEFQASIKDQLTIKVSNSWLDNKHKKIFLWLIKWWDIPENIKVRYCLDEITNLKIDYKTYYIFSLSLHLKTDADQENIKYITANFKMRNKVLYETALEPRVIWQSWLKVTSNEKTEDKKI